MRVEMESPNTYSSSIAKLSSNNEKIDDMLCKRVSDKERSLQGHLRKKGTEQSLKNKYKRGANSDNQREWKRGG